MKFTLSLENQKIIESIKLVQKQFSINPNFYFSSVQFENIQNKLINLTYKFIDDIQDLTEDIYDQLKQKVIEDNVFPLFQKVIELKIKSEYARNISELQSIAL